MTSFADRVLGSLALLRAKAPCCGALVQADPSFQVATVCVCGTRLWPKRLVTGVSFTVKEIQ